MLNSQYFKQTTIQHHVSVRPIHPGMVLYDKATNTPLTHFMIRPVPTLTTTESRIKKTKIEVNGQFVLYPRHAAPWHTSAHQWFQASGNVDEQKFEMIVTNLCPKGMQSFHIKPIKPDGEVALGSVNEINCVQPLKSNCISGNHLNEDREFKLCTLKETKVDPVTGVTTVSDISVQKAEEEKQVKGVYFAVEVCPEKKFEWKETEWRVVDHFVMVKPVAALSRGVSREGDYLVTVTNERNNIQAQSYGGYGLQAQSYRLQGLSSFGGISQSYGMQPQSYGGADGCLQSYVAPQTRWFCDDDDGCEENGCEDEYLGTGRTGSLESKANSYFNKSKACELKGGDVVKIQTREVVITLSDNTHYCYPIIAFSVMPNVEILPDTRTESDFITEAKQMIESKVLTSIPTKYQSEECCVCCDPNPTTVIALCGHVCLCQSTECTSGVKDKCPICRAVIRAKVTTTCIERRQLGCASAS
jgi:hypothetical protein